jgi:hypothetical protein
MHRIFHRQLGPGGAEDPSPKDLIGARRQQNRPSVIDGTRIASFSIAKRVASVQHMLQYPPPAFSCGRGGITACFNPKRLQAGRRPHIAITISHRKSIRRTPTRSTGTNTPNCTITALRFAPEFDSMGREQRRRRHRLPRSLPHRRPKLPRSSDLSSRPTPLSPN